MTNAITAKYVGPDGLQLFDGTVLRYGDLIAGVGADEAASSSYWEIPSGKEAKGEVASDVSERLNDWSFGSEAGGGGTGRPLTEEQTAAVEPPPAPTPDPGAEG